MSSAIVLLPELLVLAGLVTALLPAPRRSLRLRAPATFAAILGAIMGAAFAIELVVGSAVVTVVPGLFRQDRFALFAKSAVLLATLVTLLVTSRGETGPAPAGPLLACLAGMFAASAPGLLPLLLWTEVAVAAGLLVGWREGKAPSRNRLFAALGTGLAALAGVALLYAVARSATLTELAGSGGLRLTIPVAIAVLLVELALAGQLVGFQWFGPIGAGIAGLSLLRFASATGGAAGAPSLLLPALAAILMLVAALGALSGGPARHLLGWAALLQVGWLVAAVAGGGRSGLAAGLFLVGAFMLAAAAGGEVSGELPHGSAGLVERGRRRALGRAACLLSLAGLPPLAGFFGVLAVSARLATTGLFWLVAAGLLASAIVAFPVVRDIRLAFLSSPGEVVTRGPGEGLAPAGALLVALLLLAYGLFANPISGLAFQGAAAAGLR